MRLSADDLAYLSECAIAAAQQAGQLIEGYAARTVAVQHKSGGDSHASQVVTEVDLLSEDIIVKTLRPSCERYDIALLAEESEDDKARLQKDFFLVCRSPRRYAGLYRVNTRLRRFHCPGITIRHTTHRRGL